MRTNGMTIIELIVVLAMLGLILGESGLAWSSLRTSKQSEETVALRGARAVVIHSGARGTSHGVLFLPDGRAIGPGVDPLTGTPYAK